MWCSAATLTRTTQGTGPVRLRAARSVGSSTSPTMPSGPSRVTRSRTGADPSGPEPTSTACSASGALTGHGGLVVDAGGQPGHDLRAARPPGTTLSSGGTSSSWPWPVGRAGLEPGPPARAGPRCPGSTGRSTRVSSSTRSASGRSAGSLPRSSARSALAVVGVVLEARGVPAARRRASRGRSRRSRRAPRPRAGRSGRTGTGPSRPATRTASTSGGLARRPGSRRAACRPPATVGAPRSRRYWRAASMLASQAGTRSGSSCSPAESPVPS